jgi:hypothetical protein
MKFLLAIIAVALVFGCSKQQENKSSAPKNVEFKEGDMFINFKDDASDADVKRVLGQFKKSELMFSDDKIYFVHDTMLSGNEKAMADRISGDSAVEYAEPNNVKHALEGTRDPYFLRLWGLKNYGQDAPNGVEGVEGADIGVLRAWKKSTGSKSVRFWTLVVITSMKT